MEMKSLILVLMLAAITMVACQPADVPGLMEYCRDKACNGDPDLSFLRKYCSCKGAKVRFGKRGGYGLGYSRKLFDSLWGMRPR